MSELPAREGGAAGPPGEDERTDNAFSPFGPEGDREGGESAPGEAAAGPGGSGEQLEDASEHAFSDPGSTEAVPNADGAEARRHETRIAPIIDEPPEDEDGRAEQEPEGDPADATHAGPPMLVEIVAGPDAGKKKRFAGVRVVVGRAPECELRLSDQSVSRRHLELIRGEKGVLLRDLGSGNGTKVNGEKVAERALQHDDEIALGKTRLRFVDELAAMQKLRDDAAQKEAEAAAAVAAPSPEGAAEGALAAAEDRQGLSGAVMDPPTAPAPEPSRGFFAGLSGPQRTVLAVVGAAILLFIVVVTAVLTRKRGEAAPDARVAQAAAKMQQARDAMKAELFEDALRAVEEAKRIHSAADAEGLHRRLSAELGLQRAFDAVRVLAEQQRFEDARTELAKLEPASERRRQEKAALGLELDRRETQYKLQTVRELLGRRELEAARQLADEIADEARKTLAADFDALEAELEAERKAESAKSAAARRAYQRKQLERRKLEFEMAFATVTRKFNGGEYRRAAAECDRVMERYSQDADIRTRARQLQILIPNFGRNFEEGDKKFKAGQYAHAVKPLRRAKELYEQIGFTGALGMQINEELAVAALAAGRDALLHGDLANAAVNFREAARLDKSDPRAKEGLDKVYARAESLYAEAYSLRDRNPKEAVAKFKVLLRVLPQDSTTYDAAKEELQKLESW